MAQSFSILITLLGVAKHIKTVYSQKEYFKTCDIMKKSYNKNL